MMLAALRQTTVSALQPLAGDAAHYEADLLLMHTCGLDRGAFFRDPQQPIDKTQIDTLNTLIARRLKHEPLAYLLGSWEFWSRPLRVTPAVLVPRADSETLVDAALNQAAHGARVLDLGTGSGAIAIAMAHTRPDLQVVATDKSHEALLIARENAASNQVTIEFRQGSWFAPIKATERFDIIVSNPPYIAADDPHLEQLTHEPQSALIAAESGLSDLQQIIAQAARALAPSGWLMLEHGHTQGSAVRALFTQHHFQAVSSHPDLAGNERISIGRLSNNR